LSNNWAGIGAHGKSQCNFFNGNSIENCTNGVLLHDSDNNSISGNNIADCEIAIHFEWLTDFNTIEQNNIVNNDCGVRLEQTSGNSFYHNNMVANTLQVSIIGYALDTWDDGYPSGGNYWNDYGGADAYRGSYQNETGSDGIGDIPVVFDGNNMDHYPLMTQWTEASELICDVNRDGKVDMKDVGYVARRFMCVPGDLLWDPVADLNNDGIVNMTDIGTVARHFGESRS
jgi:parallel beta-helix repeat protein